MLQWRDLFLCDGREGASVNMIYDLMDDSSTFSLAIMYSFGNYVTAKT